MEASRRLWITFEEAVNRRILTPWKIAFIDDMPDADKDYILSHRRRSSTWPPSSGSSTCVPATRDAWHLIDGAALLANDRLRQRPLPVERPIATNTARESFNGRSPGVGTHHLTQPISANNSPTRSAATLTDELTSPPACSTADAAAPSASSATSSSPGALSRLPSSRPAPPGS